MTQIGSLLIRLLNQHAKVSVTGIGLFQKKRVPARFDSESNQFLPPSFSYELIAQTGSDRHLLDYFIQQDQVTQEEAERRLEEVANSLLQEIEQKGTVSLAPLGFLSKQDGVLVLSSEELPLGLKPVADIVSQEETPDVVPASTGIPSQEPDIAIEEPQPPTDLTNEQVPVEAEPEDEPVSEVEQIEENAAAAEEFEGEGEAVGRVKIQEPTGIKWKKVALWGGLILLFLAVGVYAILAVRKNHDVYNSFLVKDTVRNEAAEEESTAPVEETFIETEIDSLAEGEEASGSAEEPIEDTGSLIRKIDPAKPYNIIVGSLPNKTLALQQVEILKEMGISSFVLDSNMPGNRKKISCGSYATYEEALASLAYVRQHINKDAFIYPSK
ncbi:hypothetical protein [Olivibacter sitiensis]|uniref:hypothetical protein n=1 Tax=Olivibacter sitiensis TaxID=376470 RepID=UPI000409380F|nr:hypothetical protein [Olivibacter sitiensis]